MNRYFSLSLFGLDARNVVSVGSFREVISLLKEITSDAVNKPVKYQTVFLDENIFGWEECYMVQGVLKDGKVIELGYCNFKQSALSFAPLYTIALGVLFVLSVIMALRFFELQNYAAAMWSAISLMLVCCLGMVGDLLNKYKVRFLLK